MENLFKIQMDVKNNAEDLRRYMLDLQSWEEEMKRKEPEFKSKSRKVADIPPPRNKIKRDIKDGRGDEKKLPDDEKRLKKIHAYDYSSWDKYDADKACDEIDREIINQSETSQSESHENEEQEQETGKQKTEEKENEKTFDATNLTNIDEAFYEKELGNLFVRKEKWDDAIKCYTRAIELDSRNPIYFANRALCFIKLKNFRSAEVDATVAIQLDHTYVKAYHRRAFARLALNQTEEALSDYKEIVKLEPKNVHANTEIIKIEKKLKSGVSNVKEVKSESKIFNPKSIFKTEAKKDTPAKLTPSRTEQKKAEMKKEERGKEAVLRKSSKSVEEKKLEESVKVEETKVDMPSRVKEKDDIFGKIPEGFTIIKPIQVPPHLRPKKPFRRIPVRDVTLESETFNEFVSIFNSMPSQKVEIEKKPGNSAPALITEERPDISEIENFPKPATFLQFQKVWKIVKENPEQACNYLKKTTPENLFKILRHNLESDLFSELISVMVSCAETNTELVHDILYKLMSVDRFGSLALFLSASDKKNLAACLESLKLAGFGTELLRDTYQLGSL